eukprot:m.464571 g.464571  ORF g.464571 m.464571 type:complete len:665 (-) comp23580_c0_seq1:66-2060(-)
MLAVIGLATVATGLHSAAASGVRAPHSPRDEEPTPIGTVVPHSAGEIRGSRWSVGLETQDRNYTVWDSYKAYVGPLGAKRGRLQAGWARCDPDGNGTFNWPWLDEAVRGAAAVGVQPWIELSYGNAAYAGGGGDGPGAGVPTSAAALDGWRRWVTAVAARFHDVTNEWEVWNEPQLGPDDYQPYAKLAAVTCQALYEGTPSSAPRPRIFYGTLSGGYASAGIPFINATLPLLAGYLAAETPALTLADCVSAVTYHGYGGGAGPESNHAKTHGAPGTSPANLCTPYLAPCSAVEALDATLKRHVPSAVVIQGEAGAPAEWMHGGAMEPYNWTEAKQLKWDLRAMLGDAHAPVVNFSSVFTMVDICYHAEGSNIGVYGLLKAPCTGTHPDENKTVAYARPAYRGVQTVTALWDDSVVAVPEAQFHFECTRPTQPANQCRWQNASAPVVGRHCDYANSTRVGHQDSGLADASACQQACCALEGCTCWTWSPRPAYNQGCWMFNSSVPTLPMPNLTTGWVERNGTSPPPPAPFVPTGYAFRNTTAASAGVTHVVVVDATTMLEDDRLTQCNVTVTLPSTLLPAEATAPAAGAPTAHARAPRTSPPPAVRVIVGNGTVFQAEGVAGSTRPVFPPEASGTIAFSVDLFDGPTLIARGDALPPIAYSGDTD